MKNKKTIVMKLLEQVIDPELHISIVDLGLVYNVVFPEKKKVKITMTLTTIGCPLFEIIQMDIIAKLRELGYDKENIVIDLVFDPPWTMDKMSPKGKVMLGI